MVGNERVNGCLEAFLNVGAGVKDHLSPRESLRRNSSTVTKYFVEEVVDKLDEADIYHSWAKATATKNADVRSARLENLCWRIWHENRKRRQIESELARRHVELERGHSDVAAELLEDLSEGEKHDVVEATTKKIWRNASTIQPWSFEEHKDKHLYIVLISLHGLIRGENMELGRDSDTGGQVKYAVEFAKALASMHGVYRVDLLTRQVQGKDVDWSYAEPIEMLLPGSLDKGESSGAYIVRLPCGPRNEYLRKELLWSHIQEFVDGALAHILDMARVLGRQIGEDDEELIWPQVIHGHYADAGEAAALLSGALNVPMVFTGHSLGRSKLEQLLKQGKSKEELNVMYSIFRRIEAEEFSLDAAELVITSTRQEIEQQWGLYDGFDVELENVLRMRAKRKMNNHGRYMPHMVVIPPGIDFSNVELQNDDNAEQSHAVLLLEDDPPIWNEIMHFFRNPHKPMILALSRPDPKKNITTLIKAFGECRALRDLANLTLIMGNRDNIDEMPTSSASVLTTVLKLIDKYDLYGQVAYPKHHKQCDVPAIYNLAAKTKGVFINPALVEPFGLTLIEAAAHGLPTVATSNGGPLDIERALHNGLLVNPHDDKAIAAALLKLVSDRNMWLECRSNGLKNIHLYSWPEHCKMYLSRLMPLKPTHPQWISSSTNATEYSDSHSAKEISAWQLSMDEDHQGSMENLNGMCLERSDSFPGNGSLATPLTRLDLLRKRKRLLVIAVDTYDHQMMASVIQQIFLAGRAYGKYEQDVGFILSSSWTMLEILYSLADNGISVHDFDALICSSGSEFYYPLNSCELEDHPSKVCSQDCLLKDSDYDKHIDFRWDIGGLRRTLGRITKDEGQKNELGLSAENESRSNPHCVAYTIKDTSSKIVDLQTLQKKMRMRGQRCHLVSCQHQQLHVLPLFSSRSQALRYLFVRWGVPISKFVVFVGENGDSDRQELLQGAHKTIVFEMKE